MRLPTARLPYVYLHPRGIAPGIRFTFLGRAAAVVVPKARFSMWDSDDRTVAVYRLRLRYTPDYLRFMAVRR